MSLEQIIILIVLASFPVVAFIARRGRRTETRSVEAFTVGDRRYNLFRIGAGISMTFVGGAATLNLASLGYQYGWSVLVDPVVVFVALVIGAILAARIRAGSGITLTDALAGSSPALRTILALTTLVVYQLMTAAQFVAVGTLLTPLFEGIPFFLVVAIPAFIVFAYIYFRGFAAVTNTDVLQLVVMLVLFAVPCLWVFSTRMAAEPMTTSIEVTSAPLNLLIYLALPLLFVPVSYDVNIRIKAAKSLFHARMGLIVGGFLYVLFLCVSIGIGVFMRHSGHAIESPEQTLPLFFQDYLGVSSVLGTIAVLTAIVSTLDSVAFNSIVVASNDVLGKGKGKDLLSDQKALAISAIVVLGVAMAISLAFPQILGLILAALLLYVSIFIPVAVGRWIGTIDRHLFFTSLLICGAIIVCKVVGYTPPFEPIAFLGSHLLLVLMARGLRR